MNPFNEDFLADVPPDQVALWVFVAIWELVWKGFALWKAARKKDTLWFALLLGLNTAGLLPALYIFYISKRKTKKSIVKVKLPNIHQVKKEEPKEEKKKSTKKASSKKK